MRRVRTPLAIALVLVLAVAACSKAERPSGAGDVSGAVGPGSLDAGGDPSLGSTGGASATAATGGGTAGGTGGEPGTTGTSTAGAGAPAARARVQTADAALNAYFDALLVDDFAVGYAVSTSGAQQMVRIRAGVDQYNDDREGVTERSYSSRSFRAVTSDASKATYQGKATLVSTVSGPAGDPYTETVVFENPVVQLTNGEWRVAEYTYDGGPLISYRTGATDRVGPVDVRLEVAVAYGGAIGIVVDLTADADHRVVVDDALMEFDDGFILADSFGVIVSGKPATLFFLFDRTGAKPLLWKARITIDKDTNNQIVKDVEFKL